MSGSFPSFLSERARAIIDSHWKRHFVRRGPRPWVGLPSRLQQKDCPFETPLNVAGITRVGSNRLMTDGQSPTGDYTHDTGAMSVTAILQQLSAR
jgi:hypothetical protein